MSTDIRDTLFCNYLKIVILHIRTSDVLMAMVLQCLYQFKSNYKRNFMRRIHITSSFSSPIHEVNPQAFDPHLESRIALKEKRTDKVFFCFFHTNEDKKTSGTSLKWLAQRLANYLWKDRAKEREREKERWMKPRKQSNRKETWKRNNEKAGVKEFV